MFHFQMQRLLELREEQEQKCGTEAAVALGRATAAAETCRELEALRADAAASVAAPAALGSAGDRQGGQFLLERIEEHLRSARRQLREAEDELSARMEAMRRARQSRRVLERMRERSLEAFLAEANRQEQRLMDEIALGRFARAGVAR